MAHSVRSGPLIEGRQIIVSLGGLHVALVTGYSLVQLTHNTSPALVLTLAILVGGPALVLLYGGYRLPRTVIRPEFHLTVAKWCLGGAGVGLGIVTLATVASGTTSIVPNLLILSALGSIAGFAAGTHDARAKTRELELRETVERLKTSNERLEQFAYAASHDLQEPLRMVSSYLQLIEQRYGDELDDDGQEFLTFAVDGADRMRNMILSLLEYSRVESSNRPMESVDLDAVLADVRADLQGRIAEHDAEITADSLPAVKGDARQLQQVFQNVLDNAITYRGNESPRIEISAERDDEKWIVSVQDEGIGIDPGDTDRIFQVFQSLHPPGEYSGTGIGLALCERIVERHGGDIWVDATPDEGATFSFTLPAAADK